MRDDWRGDGRMPISFRPKSGGGGGPVLPQVASSTLLLNLQADALSLNDGDPIALLSDLSGNGNDFVQADAAKRPIFRLNGGHPYIEPDGVDDFFVAVQDFASNLSSFYVVLAIHNWMNGNHIIDRLWVDPTVSFYKGLEIAQFFPFYFALFQNDTLDAPGAKVNGIAASGTGDLPAPCIVALKKVSNTEEHIYRNNVLEDGTPAIVGTVTDFSSPDPWRICIAGGPGGEGDSGYSAHQAHAYMIYSPIPSSDDQTAITVWLASKYGVTLP